MNAKQVARQIVSTCQDLYGLELVSFHNSPSETSISGLNRVSWPNAASGSAVAHPFGALEQYLAWVRDGEFTCLLFDNSLIRVSYDCLINRVVSHSLLYWPCPVEFSTPVETLSDICAGIEMCIDSPRNSVGICQLMLRTPMRFDFDPERENDGHPLVHLHTQFEETRMRVDDAMCFPAFVKKVFRTFYHSKWVEHPEIESLHEQALNIDEERFDPAAHCFQVSWS